MLLSYYSQAMAPSTRRHSPHVSVIVPTFNRSDLILRSLRSILNQTYPYFDVLVIDDGSIDNTSEKIKSVKDRRVHYFRHTHRQGAAAARNTGIHQAKGQFVAFQDSDDEWLPEKLQKHIATFEQGTPRVGVVYSDMLRVYSNGKIRYYHSPEVVGPSILNPLTQFYQVCKLGIQSAVIRRECLDAVGGFDERFPCLEDLELFVRLALRYDFHHIQEPLVKYYETNGVSTNVEAKPVARQLLLKLYEMDLRQENPGFVARESRSIRQELSRLESELSVPGFRVPRVGFS